MKRDAGARSDLVTEYETASGTPRPSHAAPLSIAASKAGRHGDARVTLRQHMTVVPVERVDRCRAGERAHPLTLAGARPTAGARQSRDSPSAMRRNC